jgi:hypothetical protein
MFPTEEVRKDEIRRLIRAMRDARIRFAAAQNLPATSERQLWGMGGGKQKQQKQQKQQKSRKMNCKKLSKRYTRYKKKLYKYSNPTQAQKMATKYLGKTAKLYPANNPVKKYRVCDPVSKKWVNFGQLGYEDYTRHKNKTRRHNYLTRTANMRGDWKKNKYSANNLSRNITW